MGPGRKSETVGKLYFTRCKWLGCPRPFCGIRATGHPLANLRATFALESKEWCRDEAPAHPHPSVGSFPSSHRTGEGVRSSVSPFSSPFWVLGTHPTRHCPEDKIPFHTSSCAWDFLEIVRQNGLGEGAGNRSKIKTNLLELCLPPLLPH